MLRVNSSVMALIEREAYPAAGAVALVLYIVFQAVAR